MNNQSLKVTIIIVSGGHGIQALKLAERLAPHATISFLVFKEDNMLHKRIPEGSKIYRVTHTFQQIVDRGFLAFLTRCWRVLPCFFESMYALYAAKSDVLISTGSGPAFIPLLAAKAMRKKVIYVESVSRIKTKSLCGRIVYKFLADKFFVQWPEAKENYPKATYAGRLM